MTYSKRLVIIDGKSVFYRGYYAMPTLATKDGTPTGGVYGFAVMALEVVKKLKPDYVCVAWDKSKTNIRARRELYPAYKANRKPAPPDFYEQIPILQDLLKSLGWPLYEADDVEADDIMGAFAKQAGAQGIESYLITSDLDVLQLVNEHTHIYTLKKGLSNIELFNVESFEEKYGVSAHQWVDVKALKGDGSDNIPGVAGVGEKTALELIKKYDTLDGVYGHLEDLKSGLRTKLETHRDMAYLSKKLVTLLVDIPLQLQLNDCAMADNVTPEFVALLRKLEFKALLTKVENQFGIQPTQASESTVTNLEPASVIALNERDLQPDVARVVAMSPDAHHLWISSGRKTVAVVSLLGKSEQPQLGATGELEYQEVIESITNGAWVGHDLNRLFHVLLNKGYDIPAKPIHDTKIGAFLLNSLERSRELSDLHGQDIDMADPGMVVAAIWQAYEDQKAQLNQLPALSKLADEMEFPMVKLLTTIEARGIQLDVALLKDMSLKFDEQIAAFEAKIHELAGQPFNISSPTQLGHILFEVLKLPTRGVKKGKTGYSTGVHELDKLRGLHPIINLITYYREYTKLKSTYIDALPKLADKNSKLHTTFSLDVAATGRLSSRDPNLQNIPTRTDIGQAIRSAFLPAKGSVFVSADYSQFELRLAAVMANDTELIRNFNDGEDIHLTTAAEVYGVPRDTVTKAQRRNAKVVNFGVLYGMSPHGLSIATGMTRDEAKIFIDRYFALRAPIRQYIDRTIEQAQKDGYVETLFGRRRPTPDLKSSNFVVREAAKRAAANMPIQGTEADLMKLAMLKVEERLQGLGQQILQIHDSILVETPKENADKVAALLKETMETIYPLSVQLKVDVAIGDNWGAL